jgi:hypothetical protein
MGFVMVSSHFPPSQSKEIGQVFGKLPKLPEYVKIVQILVTQSEDIQVYSLYEVEEDKFYDGIKAIGQRYVPYHAVEGFKYKIETCLTVREALALIGLG